MRIKYLLGMTVFFGATSILGGQSVQAQPTNSISFVKMLLLREAKQIYVDNKAIAQQNNAERILLLLKAITPTTGRMAQQIRSEIAVLQKNSVLLQARIDSTTSSLLSLSGKLSVTLASLGNPSPYTQQAAANATVIAALAARPPFGIPPVTSSQ